MDGKYIRFHKNRDLLKKIPEFAKLGWADAFIMLVWLGILLSMQWIQSQNIPQEGNAPLAMIGASVFALMLGFIAFLALLYSLAENYRQRVSMALFSSRGRRYKPVTYSAKV